MRGATEHPPRSKQDPGIGRERRHFQRCVTEVGSGIYAEKLAALADAYPEWAEQVEDEG